MQDILHIKKQECMSILRNRGKKGRSSISTDNLLKRVKYLKKRDLIHLATIRGLVFNETDLHNMIQALYRDIFIKKLKPEIYRDIQKRKYLRIIKEVKRLRRLKNTSLTKIKYFRRRFVKA